MTKRLFPDCKKEMERGRPEKREFNRLGILDKILISAVLEDYMSKFRIPGDESNRTQSQLS